MSQSLTRVKAALQEAGLRPKVRTCETETRTAAQAAAEAGVEIDRIAKSIIVMGRDTGRLALFITAGGSQVNSTRASACLDEPVALPDADMIRSVTGFAVGGVAPVGHKTPIRAFFDPYLIRFPEIWAAAGTPRHIFAIAPMDLIRVTAATVQDFTAPREDV